MGVYRDVAVERRLGLDHLYEKFEWLDLQGERNLCQCDHCRIAHAPLYATDVGPMQAAFEGQIFLRPALFLPEPANVEPNLPADIHRLKQAWLQTFDLQTISLILVDFRATPSVSWAMEKAPSSPSRLVDASSAKFIKLGPAGALEKLCISDGTLRLAYYDVPHEMALAGNRDGIQKIFLEHGHKAAQASSHARQVLDFYHAPADTVWITFHKGLLWWCRAKAEIEFLGHNQEACPNGSRLRRTLDGWHSTSVNGHART